MEKVCLKLTVNTVLKYLTENYIGFPTKTWKKKTMLSSLDSGNSRH